MDWMLNSKAINKFLGLNDKDRITATGNLEKIQNQAISNIKEFTKD